MNPGQDVRIYARSILLGSGASIDTSGPSPSTSYGPGSPAEQTDESAGAAGATGKDGGTGLPAGDVTRAEGFFTRDEILARYEERSGRSMSDARWYQVLALWKIIVFMEGNYKRAIAGNTDDPYLRRFGVHPDALDVARPQRPPAADQPPLDHRRVPDEHAALPAQRMDPAEPMVPVLVGELTREDVVEQGARGAQRPLRQRRRVRRLDHRRSASSMISSAMNTRSRQCRGMPSSPYSAPASWPAIAAVVSASSPRLTAARIAASNVAVVSTAHCAALSASTM